MSSDSHGMEICEIELRSLTELARPPAADKPPSDELDWDEPPDLDDAGRRKWRAQRGRRR